MVVNAGDNGGDYGDDEAAAAEEGGGGDEAEDYPEDDDLYADIVPGLAQVDGVSYGGTDAGSMGVPAARYDGSAPALYAGL